MPASTSRSPACSRRAWSSTRPTARPNGEWVEPAEVKIDGAEGNRRATLDRHRRAGRDRRHREDVEVEAQHRRPRRHHRRSYGADTARWFMLSDSPPERDVEWTERGVQGAWRFVQRLWRLVGEAAEIGRAAPACPPGRIRPGGAGAAQGDPPRAGPGIGRHRKAALQCLRGAHLRVRQYAERGHRGGRVGGWGRPATRSLGPCAKPLISLCNCSIR